jgi:hypothetical protein
MNEGLELAKIVLPEGILEYFSIKQVKQQPKELHIYMEEQNLPPIEYRDNKLTSKGFFDEIKVQDFPIRGKEVYLLIKRRRWFNEDTGGTVYRNWALVAQGTRMTEEFALFLKVINRYQTRKL